MDFNSFIIITAKINAFGFHISSIVINILYTVFRARRVTFWPRPPHLFRLLVTRQFLNYLMAKNCLLVPRVKSTRQVKFLKPWEQVIWIFTCSILSKILLVRDIFPFTTAIVEVVFHFQHSSTSSKSLRTYVLIVNPHTLLAPCKIQQFDTQNQIGKYENMKTNFLTISCHAPNQHKP